MGKYKCKECPHLEFTWIGNIKGHVEYYHYSPGYQCNVCNKVYKVRRAFVKHIKKHEDATSRKIVKNCNLQFPDLDQQVRPYFGPGSKRGLYYCLECVSTQKSHSNMTNHIESKHLSLSLKCKFCHGISKTRRSFQAHLKHQHKDQGHLLDNKGNYILE